MNSRRFFSPLSSCCYSSEESRLVMALFYFISQIGYHASLSSVDPQGSHGVTDGAAS